MGKIARKIDLSNSNFNVKSVELLVQSKTFENGKIIWQLLGDAKALLPTPGKFERFGKHLLIHFIVIYRVSHQYGNTFNFNFLILYQCY